MPPADGQTPSHHRSRYYNRHPEKRPVPEPSGSIPDPAMASPKYGFGDSLGLLALILGVLAVVLTPPVPIKALLLLAAVLLCIPFFRKSHWTYSWRPWQQWCVSLVVIGGWLAIGVPQLITQWRTENRKPTAVVANKKSASMQVLKTQSPQLEANKKLPFNIYLVNAGDETAYDTHAKYGNALITIPDPSNEKQSYAIDAQVHSEFLDDALKQYGKDLANGERGLVVPSGGTIFNTVWFSLSQQDMDGLANGTRRLYLYAWSRWRDNKGDYEHCIYLLPGATTLSTDMVWHNC